MTKTCVYQNRCTNPATQAISLIPPTKSGRSREVLVFCDTHARVSFEDLSIAIVEEPGYAGYTLEMERFVSLGNEHQVNLRQERR